jgi:hypothetical protein
VPTKFHHLICQLLVCLFVVSLTASMGEARVRSWAAAPEQRFDIVIGLMCIGDVPRSAYRVTRTIQHGSDLYEDFTVDWRAEGSAPLPIVKFLKERRPSAPSASCRETDGDVLLTGDLHAIRLRARSSSPGNTAPARVIVEPNGLDLTVGRVHSGLAPIFGGALDLAGSMAWIANKEAIAIVEGQSATGALEITSWARTVKEARLVLRDGAPPQTFDLSSRQKNITLLVPMTGADTELLEGRLVGKPPAVFLDNFELPASSFQRADFDIGELSIERKRADTSLRLGGSSIKFASAVIASRQSSVSIGAGHGTIVRISSHLSPSADLITVVDPRIEGLVAEADSCSGRVVGVALFESTRCKPAIVTATQERVHYTMAAQSLGALGFSHVFAPTAGSVLEYAIDGDPTSESLTGRLSAFTARAGALRFETISQLGISRTALISPKISIPIDINVPAAAGKLVHEVPGGRVLLEGRLDTFRMHGSLVLEPATSDPWRLEIPRGGLKFKASGIVTYEPVLFGGQTQFIGAGIGFEAQTDIVVGGHAATGRLLFSPQLTSVLDPHISLGRSPEGVVFKAPARFDANAELSVDLSNGTIDVESGRLLIRNAAAVVEPGHPATIGDIKVEDGGVRFASLAATFRNGTGQVELRGMEAEAQRVSSVPQTEGGTSADQIAWSGKAQDLLRSEVIAGRIERDPQNRQRMRLVGVVVRDTCIAVSDATVGRAGAFVVHGESLRVCVNIWSDDALVGELAFRNGTVQGQFDDGEGRVTVPALDLHVLSGTPRKPTGTGRVVALGIQLNLNTPIEIKQSCIGYPDFQAIKARTRVEAAAGELGVVLKEGALSGSGSVAFAKAHLNNSDDYDCRTDLINWKLWDAVKIKTHVPCPTWSDPFRWCLKEITIVPEGRVTIDSRLRVYGLTADLDAQDPRLVLNQEDGKSKLKVCAGRYIRGAPLIAASYVFQPRTPVPGFDRFIGDLLGFVAAPFESMIVSFIANLFTTSISLLRLFGLGTFCS